MRRNDNATPKLHIRRGDLVQVLSGDERRKTGRVLRVMPRDRKAVVEGINMITKHLKRGQQGRQAGEIVQQEAPIAVSKLQVIEPKTGEPTRIGRVWDEAKGWVRISRKTGNPIPVSNE